MSPYDVLLSHSGTAVPTLESLARKLQDAGVKPFFDRWHLVPGEPRQEALENALDQSRTCAVFLDGPIGPWQNEQMRLALGKRTEDPSFRVIPVLLPGSHEPGEEQLPHFLRQLTWVDFRAGLDDEEAFHRLLAGIRGEPPGPGRGVEPAPPPPYRCMAPPRESFVQRIEYERVVEVLCSGEALTALRGAGGFGKTAIAQEACYDPRVRDCFPDGILWVKLGEDSVPGTRLARTLDLIRWWTEADPPAFQTLHMAEAHWRRLMTGRRVLLVLDDAWHPEDLSPFQGLGPGSALLIATRDRRTLPSGALLIEIDAMEITAAVQLLATGLPAEEAAKLEGLAVRLGEWPLLLKIVNRHLYELIQEEYLPFEQALREVEEALETEGLTAFDREDLESHDRAVAQTLGASFRRLPPGDTERFQQLAIFPQDREVPLSVLERFWQLNTVATRKLCSRLHDLSLLLRFDRKTGTILLHDVIRAFLLKRHSSEIPALHRRLLAVCRPPSGRWADLPRSEGYLWRNLTHHLAGSGAAESLLELLFDFGFLQAKLEATDVNSLLRDYSYLMPADDARLLQDALRLSAHVLARDPRQLAGQLLGRLQGQTGPAIDNLLREAQVGGGGSWLRPRTASLSRPGGPLLYTLEGHSGGVLAITVLNHRRILSASLDETLRVWDLESRSSLFTLRGHRYGINAVTALSWHRAVSAGADKTLRLWDTANGKALRILEGHTSGVHGITNLDGTRIISASSDETLRAWNLETGQSLQVLRGHTHSVTAVASLDAHHVVSGSLDKTLRLWEMGQKASLRTLTGHTQGITGVAALGNGRIVSASADGTLRIWDLATGQTLQVLEAHPLGVSALAVMDSQHVLSAADDGALLLWDLGSGKTVNAIKAHPTGVTALAVLLPDRRVVSASADGTLRCWDLTIRAQKPLDGHSNAVLAFAMMGDRRMLSASSDGTLRIWDLETGQVVGPALQGHSGGVSAVVALGPSRALSGSFDRTLRLWDLDSRECLATFRGHSAHVTAVARLDGLHAVSASADATLRVWNLETGEVVNVLQGHSRGVSRIAVLDACRIVSVSNDGTLQLWNLQGAPTARVIDAGCGELVALDLLDGERAITSSQDGTLLLWDLAAGRVLKRVEGEGEVRALAVLDPGHVITASTDEMLRLRSLDTGRTSFLCSLEGRATGVDISPDGRFLVAGDSLGQVHFFHLHERPVLLSPNLMQIL
jgi:WD40 repeat protein